MVGTRRALYPNPLPNDPATPISDARAPQPPAEGVEDAEITLPSRPDTTVRDCIRSIQGGLGVKDYQMSGTGSSEEKRREFHRFHSTLSVVLRNTHPHYPILLDIRNELPADFVSEKGVNEHLFSILFLLTSGAARSAIERPRLVASQDGRRALMLLFTHLAPVTEAELRGMLRGVQDFRIHARSPPVPQADQLVAMREQYDLAAGVTSEELVFIQDFRLSLSCEFNNTHFFMQNAEPKDDLRDLHRRAHAEYELIVGRQEAATDSARAFAAINPPTREWRQSGPRPGRGVSPYAHPNKTRNEPRGRGDSMICVLCKKTGHGCTRCPLLPTAVRAVDEQLRNQRLRAPPSHPAGGNRAPSVRAAANHELAEAFILGTRAAAKLAGGGDQFADAEDEEQFDEEPLDDATAAACIAAPYPQREATAAILSAEPSGTPVATGATAIAAAAGSCTTLSDDEEDWLQQLKGEQGTTALKVSNSVACGSQVRPPATSTLCIDTAANRHLSCDRHLFRHFSQAKPPSLMVAAATKSATQAVGTAEFDVPDKRGKPHRVTLENACYSPSQPFNLVSMPAILGQTASNPRRIAESPDFDKRLELTLASRRKPVIPVKLENGMCSVVAHACAHTCADSRSGPNVSATVHYEPLAAVVRTRGAQRGLTVPTVDTAARKVVTPAAITPTRGTVDWQ